MERRTVSERLLAMALCLVLFMSMMPSSISQAHAEELSDYGIVSATESSLTISDNGTANVTVMNSDVITLEYEQDDGSRGADGWWIGIMVTAPETLTDDAYYISDGTEKSFAENKEDGENYINMWVMLTVDDLNKDEDGVLDYTWKYYWDGTEASEQTIVLFIDASKAVLKNADGTRAYPSAYGTLSSTYGGTLSGEDTDNTVLTVSGVNVPYDTTAEAWRIDVTVYAPDHITSAYEGENEITSPATYYLELEPEGDNYTVSGELSGTFYWDGVQQQMSIVAENVTLMKMEQAALTFATAAPDDQYLYDQSYTNVATGGTIGDISYKSSDTDIATVDNSGKVIFQKTGTVTITAIRVGNEVYAPVSASYTLTIVAGEQEIEITGDSVILYNPDANYTYTYTVAGITSTGDTSVSSSNEAVATAALNSDGDIVVTPVAAGKFTLKVSNAGDVNYNAGSETMDITVLIEESTASFEKSGNQEVTYNDNGNVFTNALIGIQGNRENITYTSSNTDVATVDGDGNVTMLKAGETTITANKAADDKYSSVELSYVLKIHKADQTIAFENKSPYIKVGIQNYQQNAVETSALYGTGSITYTVVSADLDYETNTFNSDTGFFELKCNKSGTITVQATKAADDCYNAASTTYTLTVEYEETPDPAYTLSGDAGNNGWYIGAVTIYPAEGYKISYASEFDDSNWSQSLQYDTEGGNSTEIYLRNTATSGITRAITVEELHIDTACPTNLKISYSDDVWGKVMEAVTFGYYNAQMTVTISAEDAISGVAAIYYNYNGGWLSDAPDVNGQISFKIDPEYKGAVRYYAVDNAGLESATYIGEATLIIDSLEPGINVSWSDAVNVTGDARYYAGEAVATVVITEDNFFDGEDVKISGAEFDGEWTAATDEEGNEIESAWVNTVTLNTEGDHTVVISYTDRSKNEMDTYTSETIVIDCTAPIITLDDDLNGTCTNQIVSTQITVVERNFDASNVVVTLEGKSPTVEAHEVDVVWDEAKNERHETVANTYVATVTISGDSIYTLHVDITDPANHFDDDEATFIVEMTDPTNLEITYSDDVWGQVLEAVTFGYYNAQMTVTISAEDVTSGVAAICYNYNGEWLSAAPNANGEISFKIDPEYRGNVQYYAVDKAGNDTDIVNGQVTLIVDTIEPGINVSWSDAVTVASDTRYYAGKAVATVVITEANFFDGEEVEISGGAFDAKWKIATDEKGDEIENAWVNTVTLDGEGDHTLTISYTDRSKNKMDTYNSETIVIDYTAPVISASISAGTTRQYHNQTQSITISVTEKNFDASLVNIDIGAVDSAGTAVNGNVSYGEWSDEGSNVHTLEITFSGDANYTLNASCKDLAGRSGTMDEQLFTVDKTVPADMTITYSTSVLSQILDGITFSYYNAPVTVTISAVDTTAGIDSFSYNCALNNGVSSVNQGGSGTVSATQNGNTYTASFQVPASVLTTTNQFNGYISFTAVDRSGNTSTRTHQGSQTVIVDNISPTSTVTYNTPYQEVNDISYYSGNIEITITINEANFDSGDVVVNVTKDGAAHAVNVAWINNSADSHTGAFSLTEDGNYTLSVSYTDKSGNQMADYTSNQLTLDTTAPTIQVSNIVANSANKDAEYGFAINIDDTNLDAATMNPVLMAVVQNENGLYTTTQIDLGDPTTVVAGQTYTYTVENLTDDALYTLSYEAADMAGNITNTAVLDDGEEYGNVPFSINRNGSTFGFGDDYTESIVNQYYVYEVYDDVVIVEVNVDPIEDYVVMLNGEKLKEGVDYTTEGTSGFGEWSKRTYVINKDMFAAEGEYSIVVSSKDKTETTAYSDVKNLSVAFLVDQTAPVLTISGLEAGGRYQINEQTVTVIPTDDGGCLYSMAVLVLDSKSNPLTDEAGNDISVRFEMSGEEFVKYLKENDGKVTFTVPEGLNLQAQIICNDCAAKVDGTTNAYNEVFKKITVSQNQLLIFYANTPLFIGTIVGVLALVFIVVLLIKWKKDKKDAK